MQIILSGGDFGGEIVTWEKHGVLDDGREYMNVSGFIYALIGSMAVFYGVA